MTGLEFNLEEAVKIIVTGRKVFLNAKGSAYSLRPISDLQEFDVVFFESKEQCFRFFNLGPVANAILHELWPKARVLVHNSGRSVMVWPAESYPIGELIHRIGFPLAGVKVEKVDDAYTEDVLPENLTLISVKGYTFKIVEKGDLNIHDIDYAIARRLKLEGG